MNITKEVTQTIRVCDAPGCGKLSWIGYGQLKDVCEVCGIVLCPMHSRIVNVVLATWPCVCPECDKEHCIGDITIRAMFCQGCCGKYKPNDVANDLSDSARGAINKAHRSWDAWIEGCRMRRAEGGAV